MNSSLLGVWHYRLDSGAWREGIRLERDRTLVMRLPGVFIASCRDRNALFVASFRNNGYDVLFQHSIYTPTMFRTEIRQ